MNNKVLWMSSHSKGLFYVSIKLHNFPKNLLLTMIKWYNMEIQNGKIRKLQPII